MSLKFERENGDQFRFDGDETWQMRYRKGPNEFGPWHNIYYRDANKLYQSGKLVEIE